MTLSPGTKLGPYEILSPLGAGGMGEVWRAHDSRLGRDVAIKVLPHHLSANPEVRARFEREAKAISSLNHPNICTLFDVGRARDEAGSGETDYLVMELIEGETLADRLARGPLPPADVLKLGAQIADALDRAHCAGVVHRDLKPGNVMLTRSGAKLMDFGLARATGLAGAGAGATPGGMTQSPTVAQPLTAAGAIVGTFQYMSPEQLEGRDAGTGADVWALGCVLYEMATGRRAFAGESQASLIGAIMKDTPRPLAELAPLAPAGLERLVRACLTKDPEERWQGARDLATELRWLVDERPGGSTAVVAASGPETTYRALTFGRGSITNARFASDGRTVIYDAAWDGGPRRVYMTRTESPETTELALPSAALLDISRTGELALSLDRRYLGSWWLGTGMLAQAPMFGGSPREILGGVYDAAWFPDGRTLALCRRVGLENVVEFPLGNPVFKTHSWVVGLRVSPDGRHVAFFDNASGLRGRLLTVVDRDGRARALAEVDFWYGGLAWRPDGQEILFVAARDPDGAVVLAVDLEGNRRRVLRLMGAYGILHDVSADGDLLLSRAATTYALAFSRPGQPRDVDLGAFDFPLGKGLSDDGRTVLFDEQGVAHGGETQTFVRGTDGSAPVRLGPGYARDLSPDGRWALNVHEGQLRILPVGAGAPRVLDLSPVQPQQSAAWHPDGGSVIFLGSEPGAGVRLYSVPTGGGAPRPVTPEGVGFPSGTIAKPVSPDGSRVFAVTRESDLCVYELAGGAQRGSFPLAEDEEPIRWSGDGRSIFAWRRGDVPARVVRIDIASGERTPWRESAPADRLGLVGSRSVVLTPDGESCAHTFAHLLSELFVVRGPA